MKLFSKIISAVAAISMVATMAVMPVAHAENPTLKLTATPNAEEKYVDLTVSYTGAKAKTNNSGIVVNIGDKFGAPEITDPDYEDDYWGALVDDVLDGWSTAKPKLDGVTFAVQATQIKFATATSATTTAKTLDASCDNLFTVRLYSKDDAVWTTGYEFTLGDSTIDQADSALGTLTLDYADAEIEGSGQVATTYTVTADATVTVDKTEAEAGETVTVTPVVPSGKQVKEVKYNNTVITPVEGAYTFTMPAEAVTVTATFEDIPPVTYAVTADATVTVDKTTAAAGETVTVTPVVPSGKQVKEVKYNNTVITPVEGAYTFTMPAEAVTVTATFEPIPEPDPEATFETKEASANNAVGFAATIKSLLNASEITRAGFVFANVNDKYDEATPVDTTLRTDPIDAEGTFAVGGAFTYEFKNLTGFDKFGLMAIPYVVTDKGIAWGDAFGEIIPIVK